MKSESQTTDEDWRRNVPHLPPRTGVGLKSKHFGQILEDQPDIGWFEVHAENYMGEGGPPHRYLGAIVERYPLSVHGVALSIGGEQPLDLAHLGRLKTLLGRYPAASFSEHLAWSTHEGTYFSDLLPFPYNEETLKRVSSHVAQVQEYLDRQILMENPSAYFAFEDATMSEIEFLRALVSETGCGLLLDVNNVYISSINNQFDARSYLLQFPFEHVGEIHLAGYKEDTGDDDETVLIDTHDREVADQVIELYQLVINKTGALPTLIEWDADIPSWQDLFAESQRIENIMLASSLTHSNSNQAT